MKLFPSVDSKIGRAQSHLDAIKEIIVSWRDSAPYSLVREQNLDATRYSVFFKIRNELPVEAIALLAGDCVHNLRSALDHLVYQISVRELNSDPPPEHKKIQFPIGIDRTEFDGQLYRVWRLSQAIKDALERAQSYHRPHPELPPSLPLLSELDNSDKHRLLRPALSKIAEGTFEQLTVDGKAASWSGAHFDLIGIEGPLKNNMELAAVVFPRPTPHARFNLVVDVKVTIRHAKGPTGVMFSSVEGLLDHFITEVKTAVDIVRAVIS